MERQADPERVWLGWTERVYASIPLSPVMVGTAIAGVLVLAFGVSEFALGRHLLLGDIEEMPSLVRSAVVHCLLAAYLPTAYIYLLRGYRGTLDQLRGDLDCSDAEVAELRARIGRYYTVGRGLAGLAGIGIVIWITRATTPPLEDPWAWSALAQEVRWHRVLSLWNGPWIGIFILAAIAEGRRLTGLAARVSRVDLLDLQPLLPFTRQALLNALLLAGLAGIALLTVGVVQSGFWVLVAGIWTLGAVAIGINLAAALLPVHRLIRDAKQTQLDWCRHALIRERTKLQEGGAERSRIDEIVAYRDVVQGVSAWPFDSSTAVRILLYLLIPLGSWAGGAIVERFVDSLLG
jgi:uncharacterized membrane protein YccF (DUF307 family)